jgi:hypothetical protein
MVHIHPPKITKADVDTLLAASATMAPAPYDGSAAFDFTDPELTVFVNLDGAAFDAAARRRLERALCLLPQFHARVVKLHEEAEGDEDDGSDHWLSHLEVDGSEVHVWYCACYNSTWCQSFRIRDDGGWE